MLLSIGMTGVESVTYFAAFMAFIGSVIGNIILFQMVRQGRRLVTKEEAAPGRFQRWFRQYGLFTVFVPAVVPISAAAEDLRDLGGRAGDAVQSVRGGDHASRG